jgi:hypothetical protein
MLIDLPLTEEDIRKLYKPMYQPDIDVFIDDDTYLVTTKNPATPSSKEVTRLAYRKKFSQGVYLGFGLISRIDIEKMLGWKVAEYILTTIDHLCPDPSKQGRFLCENYVKEYYGIGDSPEQIFSHPVIKEYFLDSEEEYICTLRQSIKAEDGGWRWHKNGEYIGVHEPQCEYFRDEPIIKEVWFYHFYRILSK